MASFAEQLTAARKAAGMTQEELSEAVHVARSTISNWERGQRQPDLDTLQLLSKVLRTDFIQSEYPAEAENDTPVNEKDESPITETPASRTPRFRTKRFYVTLAAVLLAAVLIGFFAVMPALRNRSAASVPSSNGTRYSIADYDKTTPNEDGKAYLTIVKTLSVRPGDGKDYYAINFTAREDNGIAFSIERLDMVIFFTDHADPYAFSHDDLANAGYEPDMPAYGFLSIDNGFPTDQNGLQGMSIRIMGKDANGEELVFTSYLSIP